MKTILITGAGSGIGRAVASLLYEDGWNLGLLDINREPLAELSGHWDPGRYSIQVADVTNADMVSTALGAYMQTVPHLDVLFNCAGVLEIGDFESIDLHRHHQILDINNRGLLNCTYVAFPYLRDTKGARVINMSSASSLFGVPGFASYSASKFWVKGFTESLNVEWARHDITVMDIEPPFVRTPMLAGKESQIIQRLGVKLDADDIARQVLAALTDTGLHHPVGLEYKLLRTARKYLPDAATRTLMKVLSGY
ncbi:MAG: SDR family oxidoreductase [Pseudomonadota bacterium]|nr:SDR family oxidoreductase [Pseudomonadota bacterium]